MFVRLFCAFVLIGSVRAVTLQSSDSDNLHFLILHNNDMHARFEETSSISGTCKEKEKKVCVGGFARLIHVVREFRKAARDGSGPQVLFLNAGDTYTGTAYFGVHKWKIVADFLNVLQPDAMCLGNHEFDNEPAGLAPCLNALTFPVVAANLDFSEEPIMQKTNVTKSVILKISERKIGVIGYLTPETRHISIPRNVIFRDEVEAIREESERLDQLGVKIIIALGHSGFEMDKKIAKEVPLVDVVVGGHTNTFLWNGPKPDIEKPTGEYPNVVQQKSGKKVPVVQAYAYTKYLGRLNVTFDSNGDLIEFSGQPLLLSNDIPQDKDVLDRLVVYSAAVDMIGREVVGRSKVLLDGDAASCRFKECNFGNFIVDAMVAYHASRYSGTFWTDAPIGIFNGGGIRNSIDPAIGGGNITRDELLGALPFANQMYAVNLNGTDLLQVLEVSVRSNGETSRGEFLQISGLHVLYDLTQPTGSRVVEVKTRCADCAVPTYKNLNESFVYTVVLPSFILNGGDGYDIIRNNSYNQISDDISDIDVVAWYLMKKSPVYPEEQERIVSEIDDKSGSISVHSLSVFYTVIGMYMLLVVG